MNPRRADAPIPMPRARCARAFTLVEASLVVIIIGVIASLSFVALARVIKASRAAGERQMLISFRNAIDGYRNTFGSLPPLVDDRHTGGPVSGLSYNPWIRDNAFLRYADMPMAPRYSFHSLPYYILGVLDAQVDGIDGPGFTEPQNDGSFKRRGHKTDPLFDISRNPARLKRDTNPANPYNVTIVDRWGNAVRYYRWLPRFFDSGVNKGQVDQYFVPRPVGDPNTTPELRDASYAVMSVGPDGETDEGQPLPTAGRSDPATAPPPVDELRTKDDIVEVGR